MTDTRRRVKLYALNAERQWDDKGTGHVTSTYVERLKGMSLLVRAESDGSLLLESKIQPDTAYQKQQETLIVWSEGDNFDLALSFQEKAGCDEIWEKICQVQGKDPSVDFTQDIVEESEDERCFDDMNDSVPPIELPPCELGRLEEISELVNSCLPSPIRREKLAIAIENEVYIKKLLNLFHMCEDLENTEGLHHLYEIFKNIFLLNKNALFELMFAEDTIFDVVGCLEFDPSVTAPKRHREYLKSIATFHQVVKISNPQLLQKIHQTYRIQYIQDVVLPTPSVFEENMLSTLSSFIFFNKQEIVSMIQEDEKFLTELFAQLTDDKSEEIRRKELVLFLKEFCTFAQALQPPGRESFFKTLNNLGILQALEITLQADDPITKAASIGILLFIVEFSPSLVREYMLQQLNSTEDDSLLMNVIIEQMTCDSDPEMGNAVQLTNIIRMLLDPENVLTSVNKSEKTDFLNYFYKHCMHVLISPLLANTAGERPEKSDSCTVQLQSLILELLSFFVEHHTYHIKNYILHKDLLRRILVLMKSKHKYLVLYALRFMRKIVALKDEFYNRYIIKGNLFSPVVDALVANNGRYNLLDSAILEMFEFIKLEDIKSLCSHVVENFGPTLDKITYVQTFKALRVRYDQQQDRQKDRPQAPLDNVGSILRQSRFRRDPRQMDEDEEMWFNDDEDDYEAATHAEAANGPVSQQMATSPSGDGSKLKSCFVSLKACPVQNATQNGPSLASGDGGADTNEKGSPKASKIEELHNEKEPINKKKGNGSAKTTSPAKKSLVDYDGDSDEDEEEKAKEAENISSSEEEDSGKRIEVEKEKAKSEESSQSIVTTTETETETKENDKDSGSSTTTTTNAQTEKRIERDDSDKEEEPEPAAKRQRTEV